MPDSKHDAALKADLLVILQTQFLTRKYAALADATGICTVKIHVCSYSEVLKASV